MNTEITYISDIDFRNMSKREKLQIPQTSLYTEVEIKQLVLIPSNKKTYYNEFLTGDFFAYSEGKGWWRPMRYDCWSIVSDIENPMKTRYIILRGDFEYGGVNIFSVGDENHTAYIRYGGEIVIKNKK